MDVETLKMGGAAFCVLSVLMSGHLVYTHISHIKWSSEQVPIILMRDVHGLDEEAIRILTSWTMQFVILRPWLLFYVFTFNLLDFMSPTRSSFPS